MSYGDEEDKDRPLIPLKMGRYFQCPQRTEQRALQRWLIVSKFCQLFFHFAQAVFIDGVVSNFQTVPMIRMMNLMLWRTDRTMVSAAALVWARMRTLVSDTVGARPDWTTLNSPCLTTLNSADLDPLFGLR